MIRNWREPAEKSMDYIRRSRNDGLIQVSINRIAWNSKKHGWCELKGPVLPDENRSRSKVVTVWRFYVLCKAHTPEVYSKSILDTRCSSSRFTGVPSGNLWHLFSLSIGEYIWSLHPNFWCMRDPITRGQDLFPLDLKMISDHCQMRETTDHIVAEQGK